MAFFPLISTFVLGMSHALEPSHGKSFILSYLIGYKLKVKDILVLTLSMVVSHFFLLALLAVGMKTFFARFISNVYLDRMEWVTPILIILFGVYLLFKNKTSNDKETCSCQRHIDENTTNTKSSFLAGLVGGSIPCPTLLAPIVLSGASSASYQDTLLFLMVYILGMGGAMLLCIGLFFMFRTYFIRGLEYFNSKINLHYYSALLILFIGLIYFSTLFFSHQH